MELNFTAIKKMNIQSWNPLVLVLQKLPLFEGVDILAIDSLVNACSLETYDEGSVIMSEWDQSNGQAYIIISGSVDVFIGWEKISSLGEGAIFGEYALICNENRSATVRATSWVQCLALKESDIMAISDETNKLNDVLTERITENSEANRGVFKE
jgi:CRP-like cAMP-binding protein